MFDETVKRATARALKAWRENAQLSQAEIAERLGTTQATISRWENGSVTPSSTDVVMLAAAYGVDSLSGLSDAISQAQALLGQKEE